MKKIQRYAEKLRRYLLGPSHALGSLRLKDEDKLNSLEFRRTSFKDIQMYV